MVSTAFATLITSLKIESQTHPQIYQWDTLTTVMSPIGVSKSLATPSLENNLDDKSISLVINPGESIYLFTEAFYGVVDDLFQDEIYRLTIESDSTYLGDFEFGFDYGVFSIISQPDPFTLAFLGFTGEGELNAINDLVSPWGSTVHPKGLAPDGNKDAVYQLSYNSVPEPCTLLLIGFSLLSLCALGITKKKFF